MFSWSKDIVIPEKWWKCWLHYMKLIREFFTWKYWLDVWPDNVEVSHKLKNIYKVHCRQSSLPRASHFFMEKDQNSLVRGHVNYFGPHHAEIIESFTKWLRVFHTKSCGSNDRYTSYNETGLEPYLSYHYCFTLCQVCFKDSMTAMVIQWESGVKIEQQHSLCLLLLN